MADEKGLTLFRFIDQRRAAKEGSSAGGQLDQSIKFNLQPDLTRKVEHFQVDSQIENLQPRYRADHLSRGTAGRDRGSFGDAFDTDVEDIDATTILSSTVSSPAWKPTPGGDLAQPHAISLSRTADPNDARGRAFHMLQNLPIKNPLQTVAVPLGSKSEIFQNQLYKEQAHRAPFMVQRGSSNDSLREKKPERPKCSSRRFMNGAAAPHRPGNGHRGSIEQRKRQETDFAQKASNGNQMVESHAVSLTHNPQPPNHSLEIAPNRGSHGNSASRPGVVHETKSSLGQESDLESQSSQGDNGDSGKGIDDIQDLKRKRTLDYHREQLARMTYQELKDETFDKDPGADDDGLPAKLINGNVPEKLQYAFSCRKDGQKAIHCSAFFSSLTIDEFEECGDILIQKFGDVMARFKDLRQQKRALCREFEHEIEKRYLLIEEKKGAIERDFRTMRAKGNDLVPGKAVVGADKAFLDATP